MGEVIDIRRKLGQDVPAETSGDDTCRSIFRVRLCGPDLHWIGLVGGVLAEALALEEFYTTFETLPEAAGMPPEILMRIGRQVILETGPDRIACLIVAGTAAQPIGQRCDGNSVLLTYDDGTTARENRPIVFPGTEVPLFVPDIAPEPLEIAAACTGGAARLLGVIPWKTLEHALAVELMFGSAVENHLVGMAMEAYHRLAPWTGMVREVPEERV